MKTCRPRCKASRTPPVSGGHAACQDRIGRFKRPGIGPGQIEIVPDHRRLCLKRNVASGVLRERNEIIGRLAHLRELEVQQSHTCEACSLWQPQQVLGVVIAQDHDPRAVCMQREGFTENGTELRRIRTLAVNAERIPVQHKVRCSGPVFGAAIEQPRRRRMRLNRHQHPDGGGVERRLGH